MKACPALPLALILISALSAQAKEVAYLGVHTQKLSPSLSHQLNLPQGAYLEIVHLGEGSPAEKAGLQNFDVLRKVDDQILINQDQLKQLVRMRAPGNEVVLDLLRRGKSMRIAVKLEKTTLQEPGRGAFRREPFESHSFWNEDFMGNPRIRDLFEREFGSHRRSFFPDFFNRSTPDMQSPDPQGPVHQPVPDVQSFSYSSTRNQTVTTDEEGTLHYTEKDGEKFLRATDSTGKLVFEGPVNTARQRRDLPKGLLKRLEEIEARP